MIDVQQFYNEKGKRSVKRVWSSRKNSRKKRAKQRKPKPYTQESTAKISIFMRKGCWILSKNWLYASVDAGHWVEEDMYELVDFSPAVRSTRLAREAFSSPAYGLRFQSVSSRRANVYYPKEA